MKNLLLTATGFCVILSGCRIMPTYVAYDLTKKTIEIGLDADYTPSYNRGMKDNGHNKFSTPLLKEERQ